MHKYDEHCLGCASGTKGGHNCDVKHLSEKNNQTGGNEPIGAGTTNTDTGITMFYSKIVNPYTGRKVSIFGKSGQRILKNYLNQF